MVDRELYQEVLLQYSKRPINFGPMESPTHTADGHNALCGDEISVSLKVDDGKVTDAKFTGSSCAICTASSCIMTDAVKGLTPEEVEALAEKFRSLAKSGTAEDISKKLQILGGEEFHSSEIDAIGKVDNSGTWPPTASRIRGSP